MRRWLVGIVAALLLLCVSGVAYGYFSVWPRIQDGISEPVELAIAESVEESASRAIRSQGSASGELRLKAIDLDINSNGCLAGDSSFEVTNDEATICGAEAVIDNAGLTVILVDMEFGAVKAARNGRIELTDIAVDKGITGWILSADAIEAGLEAGINKALAQSQLTPVSVTLDTGIMTIMTE